jgi:hypothetical protein
MFAVLNYFSLLCSGYENTSLTINFGEKLRWKKDSRLSIKLGLSTRCQNVIRICTTHIFSIYSYEYNQVCLNIKKNI